MTAPRPWPDLDVVRRQNELLDLNSAWTEAHPGEDPDDDLEYVAKARRIMGLPPLEEVSP